MEEGYTLSSGLVKPNDKDNASPLLVDLDVREMRGPIKRVLDDALVPPEVPNYEHSPARIIQGPPIHYQTEPSSPGHYMKGDDPTLSPAVILDRWMGDVLIKGVRSVTIPR